MNVRPIREEDIEQVIQLFRLNYGDDYAIPEFYDPQWVKRGIYSDHIIWLVIEDENRVVASGAAILDFGDYNDQIAEIGRLVVDPAVGGKGLGRTLLYSLVDASDDRVEFAFGEARTTHIKTQKIFDRVGLVPLGFLPMAYTINWRESWVLSGQLFGTGRRLRQPGTAWIIPEAAPIATLSLKNLELEESIHVYADARPYPIDYDLEIQPLSGSDLVRLLKIEQGRILDPEIFGGLHLDQGISQLRAHKAAYLVASEHGNTLGAVGYTPYEDGRNVRIVELIASDEGVKGSLLRRVVEEVEQNFNTEAIDCDVSAASPRAQRTLIELGFLPTSYVPGMVFHNTSRWDVVKMMKLNVPWELGPIELNEASQAMFDVVTPAFIRQDRLRAHKLAAGKSPIFSGLSSLELDLVQRSAEEISPTAQTSLPVSGLNILLSGAIEIQSRKLSVGDCFGAVEFLEESYSGTYIPQVNTRLLHIPVQSFNALCERYPRLGVKLLRNLARQALADR
jgi:RimJ/RimL family protein N-acetyltransferase